MSVISIEEDRDDHQQRADGGTDGVPAPVAGEHRHADAEQGEAQAGERARVLEQDDRLGLAGVAHEPQKGPLAPRVVRLLQRRAEGEALERDRDEQDQDGDPPVRQGLRVLPLVPALVEREQAADQEQDDRDDEPVDVPPTAVAEVVLVVGALLRPLVADQEQDLVAGVGDGVDRLGQHRRRARERERHELRDRDPQVRQKGGDDRPDPPSVLTCAPTARWTG
jgi:hypothetical protein